VATLASAFIPTFAGVLNRHGEAAAWRLASSVRSSLDLVRAARSICDRLSLETDETVNLAVLEGHEVVNIHQVNLSTSRVSVDWLGSHTALHCTSSGKVFLAFLPEALSEELLADELRQFTPNTITDPVTLRDELALIRKDGYAMTFEELEEGLNATGAPIFGPDGSLVAAVSVSGPSYRLERPRMDQAAALTREAADEISRRLGYLGESRFSDATGGVA
jgi:DNA-binding IclR family transcriptional regulator